MNGHYAYNPLNLGNFNLQSIDLIINGVSRVRPPITADYANNQFVEAYMSNYDRGGMYMHGNDQPLTDYAKGFTLYTFNITSYDKNYIALPRYGSMNLAMTFRAALPQAVNMIVFADFNSNLKIDQVRNVML